MCVYVCVCMCVCVCVYTTLNVANVSELAEEVAGLISRWKDEEYERRLAQGIPPSATLSGHAGSDN
jgi:hypothetical protein